MLSSSTSHNSNANTESASDDQTLNQSLVESFKWSDDFNRIRSALDHEVPEMVKALSASPLLGIIITALSLDSDKQDQSIDALRQVKSLMDFQTWIQNYAVPYLARTYDKLVSTGLEQLNKNNGHIFVSNHHDILMDAVVVDIILESQGFDIANCAIGDNLIESKEATTLAALSRCFKVERSLSSPKEMLKALKTQSQYINYLRFAENSQIWIAQKEGRSKDKIDKTNPALIKMLSLAKPKSWDLEAFTQAQNIVPVAISYEWDPCDLEKARQLEAEQNDDQSSKRPGQDIQDMQRGLLGFKGTIHLAFGQAIKQAKNPEGKLDRFEVAQQIDNFIAQNSAVFASNCAAHALLEHGESAAFDKHPSYAKYCDKTGFDQAIVELNTRLKSATVNQRQLALQAYSQTLRAKLTG